MFLEQQLSIISPFRSLFFSVPLGARTNFSLFLFETVQTGWNQWTCGWKSHYRELWGRDVMITLQCYCSFAGTCNSSWAEGHHVKSFSAPCNQSHTSSWYKNKQLDFQSTIWDGYFFCLRRSVNAYMCAYSQGCKVASWGLFVRLGLLTETLFTLTGLCWCFTCLSLATVLKLCILKYSVFVIIYGICLGFGLLLGQSKKSETIMLGSEYLWTFFYVNIYEKEKKYRLFIDFSNF